jgi:hypothetical protein
MKKTIKSWFGRFGNNIQQISNAIYYCKNREINFYLRDHPLINDFDLRFGRDVDIKNRFFYYSGHNKDFDCDEIKLNKSRRYICREYIYPHLKIKEIEIPKEYVVIHIRGGDIFGANPHTGYIQNPLSYYKNIVKKFEKAIIVSEDKSNPVVRLLIDEKNVDFVSNGNILDDLSILMSCDNLATSGVGTFSVAAALLSRKIKNLYCSSIFLENHLNPTMLYDSDIKVMMSTISDYINIGEWKNSEEQRRIMIES